MQPRETFEWLAEYFCYTGLDELLALNHVDSVSDLAARPLADLAGWNFLYARRSDSFEALDHAFEIPRGWVRPVSKTYRGGGHVPLQHELIAVPNPEFVAAHKLRSALNR